MPSDYSSSLLPPSAQIPSLVPCKNSTGIAWNALHTQLCHTPGEMQAKRNISFSTVSVPVTANLHEALVHLRDVYPGITIWIDALCIDQDSLRERGHQVAQMKEIYSKAEKVISWLGPSSEDTTRLFDAIRTFDGTDEAERTSILQLDIEAHSRALENLMTRPYWNRVWVVQEMAVATDLLFMWGNDVVRSDYLLIVLEENCEQYSKWEDIYYSSLYYLKEMRRWCLEETNLAKAFRWFMWRNATEPRDKIYAILGLITEGAGRDVEPDYTISECALYAKVIRAVNKDWSSQYLGSTGMRDDHDKALKNVMNFVASQVEQCPDSFLLYEDLVQHCPHLKPSNSRIQPQTACSGCHLFLPFLQFCLYF